MHNEFRKLLKNATGESDFVIALNLDIRGFSNWSQEVESIQAAAYLAKLYSALIDRWFNRRWFFKPTGDGLLLVRPFAEKELEEVAAGAVRSAVEIVDGFGELCSNIPLLNFPLPQKVGIGVAQGAASRLVASGKVLDYSGSVLNLASRLMELARPRGVVVDAGVASGLLPETLMEQFGSANVYLPGISPKDSLPVHFQSGVTEIPAVNLSPIGEETWGNPISIKRLLRQLESPATPWHTYSFPEKPASKEKVRCVVRHPAMDTRGRKLPEAGWTKWTISDTNLVRFQEEAGTLKYSIDFHGIARGLREDNVKGTWPVKILVEYPT